MVKRDLCLQKCFKKTPFPAFLILIFLFFFHNKMLNILYYFYLFF